MHNQLSIPVNLVHWLSLRMWIAALLFIFAALGIVRNLQLEAAHADRLLTGRTTGQITKVELENQGKGYRDYSFTYTYEVNGTPYTGISYQSISSSYRVPLHELESTAVLYNPESPAVSKLPGTAPVELATVSYVIGLVVSGIAVTVFVSINIRRLGTMKRGVARTATCTRYYKTSKGDHVYIGYYSAPNGKKQTFHESRSLFRIKNAKSGIPIIVDKFKPTIYVLLQRIPQGVYLSESERKWKVRPWRLAVWTGTQAVMAILIAVSFAIG
ncbi:MULTISPECIES: hypothetical protein [unclassified Paenibacillus]|uniref:DUF3592 domain-containing protein n=1 Tax=unclassified Paenibacillus TaxID=185978 RepID=UPI001C0F5EFF|nr:MULTISPECIES: hypothetical protein [unclassified Paenibacillus]MBU5444060.1 hypothetical protein [Paenibacillus sp. MSJ-34]CAH0118666.1 hypothetical protein PAE9249_01158 [Paenibacillus sp. CECT 9249]